MLTPEYLSEIEFNKIVEIYNKLNVDITSDIINRVSQFQEVTNTTKNQIKILAQIQGKEIFDSALKKSSNLTNKTKKELYKLFKDVAKNDINDYKQLYEYQNKPFKLSENQYKIINQGLKDTNRILKNLTNSIAFRSQQIYIEAVDKAYMQVVSGAIDYNSAINNTVQKLADKGITLQDKAGRNVQLEVAVRRNVMNGIRITSNQLERDIEEYLGCNGYEVTAHSGSRPTHAEYQGKQFAKKKEDAKKYGIGWWNDVKKLWEEYNCRHSYFGIILGVSEPIYNKKELKEMNEKTVVLNGEEIPLYDATQIQRKYENEIRKQKRTVQILQKSEQNDTIAKTKLKKINDEYNKFLDETGLQKDYSRLKVANKKNVNKELKIPSLINKTITNQNQVINKRTREFIEKNINDKDIVVQKLIKAPFSYKINLDKIVIDITHPDLKYYNIPESIAHEVVHLKDIREKIIESNIDELSKILHTAEMYVNNNQKYFHDLLNDNRTDMAFCDIMSALSNGKIIGDFGHSSKYWISDTIKLNEISANLISSELIENDSVKKLLNEIPILEKLKRRCIELWQV